MPRRWRWTRRAKPRAARPSMSRWSLARMSASAAPPARICWPKRSRREVVIAAGDPDPRTDGLGIERLRGGRHSWSRPASAGPRPRRAWPASSAGIRLGRPFVTLKLAMSIDGRIALASGESRMDHRRGSPRPRPSRTRASRHDPGRARHLRGRCAAARRAARGARGSLAAPGVADPRRPRPKAGKRLG